MGSIFAAPPSRGDVSETPAPRLALDAHGGDELERVLDGLDPRTICLGAERDGLDRETLDRLRGDGDDPGPRWGGVAERRGGSGDRALPGMFARRADAPRADDGERR